MGEGESGGMEMMGYLYVLEGPATEEIDLLRRSLNFRHECSEKKSGGGRARTKIGNARDGGGE